MNRLYTISTIITALFLIGCGGDSITKDEVDTLLLNAKSELSLLIDSKITEYDNIAQNVSRATLDSIVHLKIIEVNNSRSSGTGFVVKRGYIATSYHVIEHAARGSTVRSVYDNIRYPIQSIAAIDEAHDLAIIKADFYKPSLKLSNTDVVEIGQKVFVIGNPKSWRGTVSTGIISATRPNGFLDVSDEVIQTTAPISPGSSGSPLLNVNKEVIGICYGSASIDYGEQNLNFFVPVKYLRNLLTTIR